MRTLVVEPVGGLAGDMLLAALLDAGAPAAAVSDAVASVLRRPVRIETRSVTRGGLRALALVPPDRIDAGAHARGPLDLLEALDGAGLAEGVGHRARAVLHRLGEAESRVHGLELGELRLAELGADDTLLDVVGVAAALDALAVETIAVAAIPIGADAHATLELVRGFDVRPADDPVELAEPTTPTGAAIVTALGTSIREIPPMRLDAVGLGAGSRDPRGVANVVRVLVGTGADDARADRRLLVVETNVDDLSPELVPDAIEAILEAGALDAWCTPIVMKRGRPAATISALCAPEDVERVRRAFFEHTTTLGVRIHGVARPELERRVVEIELAEGGPSVRVKIASLDGRPVSAKPEHADVVEAARKLDRPVRAVHEAASALAHRFLEEGA